MRGMLIFALVIAALAVCVNDDVVAAHRVTKTLVNGEVVARVVETGKAKRLRQTPRPTSSVSTSIGYMSYGSCTGAYTSSAYTFSVQTYE